MPKSSFKPNYRIGKPIRRRPPADTSTDDQINSINELSRTAHATWLSLLGYLAFVGVTLLGVENVDFFDPSRQTDLPLIGVAIPTASFFIFAPILGAALYIYLQLYLLKLWDELATVPNTHKNAPISDHLTPWLINDLDLSLRTDEALRKRPLGRLSKGVTIALVFLAGPMILAGFWVRSSPALNEWMTLLITALVYLALRSGFISWRYLRNLTKDTDTTTTKRYNTLNPNIAAPYIFGLVTISWLTTEGDFDFYTGVKITGLQPLARANLSGQNLSERPKGWRDINTAQRRFRATWCKRQNIPLDTCGYIYGIETIAPNNLLPLRANWCETKFLDDECTPYFTKLDKRFLAEWAEERQSLMIGAKTANLQRRDLRNANLSDAFLVQADLSNARLQKASLSFAQLEGADLSEARLKGAGLWGTRLIGTNMETAHLEDALFERAVLEGTNIRKAGLQSSDCKNTTILSATAHGADFRGAVNLTQEQLEFVIGDEFTLLPEPQFGTDGLGVWTCWSALKISKTWKGCSKI
ncbi:MAG: pentapeptide repeat-containing protein [Amylibacter sp.]